MARGGYRPNSGPQKGVKYKPRSPKAEGKVKPKAAVRSKTPTLPPGDSQKAASLNLDPLSYMLKVMNDPKELDQTRKDRMAIAAAPFVHPRAGEGKGKKEEKEGRAKAAGQGKFASMSDRLKVVK